MYETLEVLIIPYSKDLLELEIAEIDQTWEKMEDSEI
nr:MAG TPA: hypothetical protein [Bacteriophage sp.]